MSLFIDSGVIFKTMNFKNNTFLDQPPVLMDKLPSQLKLTNVTNTPAPSELQTLKNRVEQLQMKVSCLENRIRSKRKRIRRKASDVDKRHKCDFCKKVYGTIVSLNLHLRIKHRKEKTQLKISRAELRERRNGSDESESGDLK